MVRAMVGTLVEVGQGKRPPQAMKDILAAKDRRAAGVTAPAQGLYLVRVDY
jgi:tRNA pseudouridine38-40 synthase